MSIVEILTHWIYKPILQWSVLDLAIVAGEIAIVAFVIGIIKGIIQVITKPK